MIKLTIGNSVSHLTGLSPEQHSEVRELLSYDAPDNFFAGRHRSSTRYLITKGGAFPSGLLYIVQKWLASNLATVEDSRIKPSPKKGMFTLVNSYAPYSAQMDAVRACLKSRRGTVSMATGTGKSFAMALLIYELQVRTLIVVPTVELKRQLMQSFYDWFGDTKNIVIENIDSPKLKTLTEFGALIIDEAHHVAASTYRKLNIKAWSGIYHRFFFTATPFRSRDEEQMLFESVAGQVIYRLDYRAALNLGYIAPVEAYYINVPKTESKGDTWASVYKSLVVDNELRNRIIAEAIHVLSTNNAPTLVLVKEITHGETLSRLTGAPFANGENGAAAGLISMFNSREIPVLIGTVGVLGEGCDTKPCEYVLICGLGKSKNQIMQQIGRSVRRYPGKESAKVLIFKDLSHKFTKRHFAAQCKILEEEYGVKVGPIC